MRGLTSAEGIQLQIRMPSMAFDRELIEARLALELIASADMPQIAWDALDAGLDGPRIRRLAALERPTWSEVRDVLPQAAEEIGLKSVKRGEASVRVARSRIEEVFATGQDPLPLIREFWHLWIRAEYAREIEDLGTLEDDCFLATGNFRDNKEKIREWLIPQLKVFLNKP